MEEKTVAELSPMMQKYMETKAEYPDCILFYRLGDFYEMFFEDALTASRELEITLTGKNCGMKERAPMCGIPYHSMDGYLNRLVSKGYKVAICEQMGDSKTSKGPVKREVTRIVTPGTNLAPQAMEESKHNYLMAIVYNGANYGISVADVTTGDYVVTEVENQTSLQDEIHKFRPTELLCSPMFSNSNYPFEELRTRYQTTISTPGDWYFDRDSCMEQLLSHFQVGSLSGLGLEQDSVGVIAAGVLLQYLQETQKNALTQFTKITPYSTSRYMMLDAATSRNLELTETLREKQKKGSLLWVLDHTKTAMGARMLRTQLEQPLMQKAEIEQRLEGVEELLQETIAREEMRLALHHVYDLERLITRITYGTANPRDLTAFRSSLVHLPELLQWLKERNASILQEIAMQLDPLSDLWTALEATIVEEPPLAMKEGGIIRDGFSEEVDLLRRAKSDGKDWLAALEEEEKEKTGIKNLRIKYNRVFGYYLEVTNSYQNLVPDYYVRKQTLTNAERYITPKLKELEDMILGAEDKLYSLEYQIYSDLRDSLASQVERIQQTAKAIARLDMLASLAVVADRNHYVRPLLNEDGVIEIKEGRHPVVEQMIPNDMFISNDLYLNDESERIAIITGPNMAGKSTYMRQAALIVLMAQVGSFVPASFANIGVVDRIFTRVGASDDLASGQSTFMVEMTEVANILRNATKHSFLILDEIGRGTSTFDGLSIAWAVVEYIADVKRLGAKTLFATHYHELTELEGKIPHLRNYCIAVKEQGDDIVFLRKIIPGGADQSYGIQVAKLAGVPSDVILRAKEIVEQLNIDQSALYAAQVREHGVESVSVKSHREEKESKADGQTQMEMVTSQEETSRKKKPQTENVFAEQLSLFSSPTDSAVLDELRKVQIGNLTPIEALNLVYRLQNTLISG
jgi:DNA mismatch repair protein MutS